MSGSVPGTPDYIHPARAADTALVLVFAIAAGLFGLGWCAYFFYGQWQKGAVSAALFLVVPLVIVVVGVVTCGLGWLLLPFYAAALFPLAVVNVIDAHLQNQCLRQGFTIGQWTFFGRHY
jgi:hypothetical protein